MNRHEEALLKLKEGTVIPANPLVLNADRKIDEQRQRALTKYYLAAGVGGVAVAVHTTQFAIRDPKIGLFEPVLRMAAEEVEAFEKATGETIIKVAGACGTIQQAVNEAKIARDLGYDAVLLSPGGLKDYSEDQMIERTKAVADVIPVIGFYLQPSVGGRRFSFDYWQRMCEIDNLKAIKCASFNRYQTLDVVRAVAMSQQSDKIALYTGNDDNIVVDLLTPYRFNFNGKNYEKRFVGGLLGHWAVWTHTVVQMFKKLKTTANQEKLPSELLTLAAEVTDANAAFFDTANDFAGCIAGIHEVLRRQGLLEGIWCLDENETLSLGQLDEINRVYSMYPHLNDDRFISENLMNWM